MLVPEVRALRAWLRDFLTNKIPTLLSKRKDENIRLAIVICAAKHVFHEIGFFTVKYHNNPQGDLVGLQSEVSGDPWRYANIALDWAGAEKIRPMLQQLDSLGEGFSSTISALIDQARACPERRFYLRRSKHVIPCWRIKIPTSIAGMYFGDWKTVRQLLKQRNPFFINEDHCIDVQRMYGLTILLVELPGNNWDCSPGPVTQFPSEGWVYTMCRECNVCTQTDDVECHCTRWLHTYSDRNQIESQRTELPMDEMLMPEHCSDMLLGPPSLCYAKEGALNLRQFTSLKVNVLALRFTLARKKKER